MEVSLIYSNPILLTFNLRERELMNKNSREANSSLIIAQNNYRRF